MEKRLIDPKLKESKAMNLSDAQFFNYCAKGIQMVMDLHAQWLVLNETISNEPVVSDRYSSVVQYKSDMDVYVKWKATANTLMKTQRSLVDQGSKIVAELFDFIPAYGVEFDPKDFEPDCPVFRKYGNTIHVNTSKGMTPLYVGNKNL